MHDRWKQRAQFWLAAPVDAGTYAVTGRGYGASTGRYTLDVDFVVDALDMLGPEVFQGGIGFISGWVCRAEQGEWKFGGETAAVGTSYGTDRENTLEAHEARDHGFGVGLQLEPVKRRRAYGKGLGR